MCRPYTISTLALALLALTICPGCPLSPEGMMGPRVSTFSDSGCLPGTGEEQFDTFGAVPDATDEYPGCGDDLVELTVDGTSLTVVHANASYNCCVDGIPITSSVEGSVISLTETEELAMGGCFCLCCYDVEATMVDLVPGEYTVEFCWQDYETDAEQCHTEDVVIP